MESQAEFLNVVGMAGSARAIFCHGLRKILSKMCKKGKYWYVCTKFELWISLNVPFMPPYSNKFTIFGTSLQIWVIKILRKIIHHKSAQAKKIDI